MQYLPRTIFQQDFYIKGNGYILKNIMRKSLPSRMYSEENISLNRLFEMLSELRVHVAKLEMEVFPSEPDNLPTEPRKPRRGRKPRLHTATLLNRRVNLTAWLELNWPRLSVALRRAEKSGNPSEAIAELVATEKNRFYSPYQPPFYESPERYEEALGAFLKSGRYHGNPRTLAAAMAGLPELSWKRSFDICTKHPYKTDHKLQAYRDYMRRNFPDRLRELEEARTVLDVRIVLARSKTDDPVYLHLKENPDKVKEWLEAGKPVASNLVAGIEGLDGIVAVIPNGAKIG
jgi:hypothetical protein